MRIFYLALIVLFIGCATPEQKAQKLYDEGKYDEIMLFYPDLPIADRVRLHALKDSITDVQRFRIESEQDSIISDTKNNSKQRQDSDYLSLQPYLNSKEHFSIQPPKNWRIDANGQFGTLVIFFSNEIDQQGSDPFNTNINIISSQHKDWI